MNEKKYNFIVVGISVVAILLVILLSIPWGGDKKAIMKEYDSLENKNHVYETIKYEDLMQKIAKGESIQVFVGSPSIEGVNQFVYEANKVAKQFNIKTVYYLKLDNLSNNQLTNLKIASDMNISFPTLIYWEDSDIGESVAYQISSLKKFDDYGNWLTLLTEYFEQCFEE